jgi:hypothetical protein
MKFKSTYSKGNKKTISRIKHQRAQALNMIMSGDKNMKIKKQMNKGLTQVLIHFPSELISTFFIQF